jgi:YgiT-type zinc finger domain-containing protein
LDKLENKEKKIMKPFPKCPVCGSDMIEKEVEKLLRGGNNVAITRVAAEVCLHCGERLYSEATIKSFEEIRMKLERKETSGFEPLGVSYQVGEHSL